MTSRGSAAGYGLGQPLPFLLAEPLRSPVHQGGGVAPPSPFGPHLSQGLVSQGDDVELVRHNGSLGQHHLHRLPVGLCQVHDHRLYLLRPRKALQHRLHISLALAYHHCHRHPLPQLP